MANCASFDATTDDNSSGSSTAARIGLLVLLHVFSKRTAKIPASEITLAQQRWDDFKTRMDADPRTPPRAAGHDAP